MTANAFYRTVMSMSGDRDRALAKRITAAVLHALRDRLTVEEADQAVAQLPQELKTVWAEGEAPDREPLKMHREELFERVMKEAGLATISRGRWATLAVFAALKQQLSPGEVGDILSQLPKDLKELWLEVEPHE